MITFAQLKMLARQMIPGLKIDVLPDTSTSTIVGLDELLNEAVVDIANYTACLPTNKKFNAVASQGTAANPYLLSTVLGDYLTMETGGLWWNQGDGTTPQWKKLNPRTIGWLDENRQNWHEISDGSPEDYVIDGDNLYLIPAPESSLSEGLWGFYSKVPGKMSTSTSYPFSGSTVQLTHLSCFTMAIIYYARWKSMPMIGKDFLQDNYNLNKNLYINEREEKYRLLKRRRDIGQTAMFKGPLVR